MGNLKILFGKKLRTIRKEKGLTQEALGKLVNINQRQLTRIECGQNFPSADTLEKICYFLDIPPVTLFDFVQEKEELQMTGTDNNITYRAVKSGNIVRFEFSGQNNIQNTLEHNNNEIAYGKTDEEMLKIAQNSNKPITVEYFENNTTSHITIYFPDGSLKHIRQNSYNAAKTLKKIINQLKPLAKQQKKMEFVELVIQALNNKHSLEQLKVAITNLETEEF